MSEDDILVWPDGFWCYRKNYHPEYAAKVGHHYKIVLRFSDEWRERTGRQLEGEKG